MAKALRVAVYSLAAVGLVYGGIVVGGAWKDAEKTDISTPWDRERPPEVAPVPPPPPREPVPMVVSFRAAALDNSYVLQIKNDAGKLLRNVKIKVENSATGTSKEWNGATFENGTFQELGWQEGWKFYPGDLVTVTADGFAAYQVKFKP